MKIVRPIYSSNKYGFEPDNISPFRVKKPAKWKIMAKSVLSSNGEWICSIRSYKKVC